MSTIIKYGIDISQWQKGMDLTPFKDHFVILRASYGTSEDREFKGFVAQCQALNIPIGVYVYSYALNIEQAKQEARFVLSLVKNIRLDYPIYFDMEDADGYKAKNGILHNNALLNDICNAFCEVVEAEGYYVGVYASESWFRSKLAITRYDKWVASWGTNDGNANRDTSAMGGMLQFTSKFKGKSLDANVAYKDYPNLIHKTTPSKPVVEPEAKPDEQQPEVSTTTYIVKAGDNLSSIATRYKTTYQELARINGISNPSLIHPGQVLNINASNQSQSYSIYFNNASNDSL